MIALRERDYLLNIYSEQFKSVSGISHEDAGWYAYMELQNADYLLSMSEDILYWDNPCPGISKHSDVIETYDRAIRGSGEGIDLDDILIPKGVKYLGEAIGKMPLDVMIFKGKTGIGGTTLAIQDSRKWVICVGSREIVKSKSENNDNSLGVFAVGHGGATNDDIFNYEGNTIITTWSSLERVCDHIHTQQWSLLIDEPQELIRDGGFRAKDINKVLRLKINFKHCTLISATITKKSDFLNSFDDLDTLKIRWEEKRIHDIEVDKTNNLITNLAQRSYSVLKDDEVPNLHIFINKVESIIRIVTILEKVLNTDLSDRISIVASNKASNIDRIKRVGSGNHVMEDLKSVKRINFYTSTCFSGVDVEDDFGDIVIATDGNDAYTRLHLKYDILQIIGRIRNPKNDMRIHLVFIKRYSSKRITKQEFIKSYKSSYIEALKSRKYYNGLSSVGKSLSNNMSLISDSKESELVNGCAKMNKAYFMNKKASFSKDNILYTEFLPSNESFKIVQGSETFRFLKSEDALYISEEIYDANDKTTIKRSVSFKNGLKNLIDEIDDGRWNKSWWQSDNNTYTYEIKEWLKEYKMSHKSFFERFPFIENAFQYLSPDELKALEFNRKDIKIALGRKQEVNTLVLLKTVLDLKVGIDYPVADMKSLIKGALKRIGKDVSPPSTFIKKVYPGIRTKQNRIDKTSKISQEEYSRIKKDNYKRSRKDRIDLSTKKDKDGNVIEIYKTLKNEGRQKVYYLPSN